MIPSENYTSLKVREAVGSPLMHKYSEGYPWERYYQGNEYIDELEDLAREKAKKLFDVVHVNVQPYSGSPANAAVFMALLSPGDTIMGMSLSAGGHLTHGHPNITFSGKFYNSVQYGVGGDGRIDYERLLSLAREVRPKMIIAGTTAYPRKLDFRKFARVAEKVDAILLADISHIAGLVVGQVHVSPVGWAHVITTTTHKTLRGPRGALIMVTKKGLNEIDDIIKNIDRAVFPGLQGGPHNNTTAGIALALQEATTKPFRQYASNTVHNARILAQTLKKHGFEIVSGGTDNHMVLLNVTSFGITGRQLAVALESAGIVTNFNSVPNDPRPPRDPSGLRLGTPAITTRKMRGHQMRDIAGFIDLVARNPYNKEVLEFVSGQVKILTKRFPIPDNYGM